MFEIAKPLHVDENQKKRLMALMHSGKTPQKIALRARIVLMAGQGVANNAIASQLKVSRPTVLLWRQRFSNFGVPGLMRDAKRTGRKKALSAGVVQRVVDATLKTTPEGATHWTTRSMAKTQRLSHMTVHRIWKQHGLQPHRVETFKLSVVS